MPLTKDFPPRLLPAPQAAHYLGVSESKLRALAIPRRELDSKRVYDRNDLDAFADDLPYETPETNEESECDAANKAWGLVS
ncbi:helix-turn-helix domain-containing protein [Roseobacter sp. MH60115]|uniref:helix-turn-helix domain-containing protein n=1 Tax=Roseobacter sp. MH60115 TaxID=2785324 RepID=UPI0018A2A378|nr:helix-turn-helix domain-containing protein [Roseobacter sp. MH60115]